MLVQPYIKTLAVKLKASLATLIGRSKTEQNDITDPLVNVMHSIQEQYRNKALVYANRWLLNQNAVLEVHYLRNPSEDNLLVTYIPLTTLPELNSYSVKEIDLIRYYLWDGYVLTDFNPVEEWIILPGSVIQFKQR
jgi:hypothetical protein